MSRIYLITLKCSDDDNLSRSFQRKRSDAASLLARKLAYDCIEGAAGLDTGWGYAAMRRAEELDPARGGRVEIRDGWSLYVTPSIAPSQRIP